MIVLLQTKHFFIDYVFQPPYMHKNKGTYGHLGGIFHAVLHAAATYILLTIVYFDSMYTDINSIIAMAVILEFISHYHIDYFKVKLNKMFKMTYDDEIFWRLQGLDQLLHQLTYIAVISLFCK